MIRILSIFLLLIYTLTSTGATVYYHICGHNSQISLSVKDENAGSCVFCTGEDNSSNHKSNHCEQPELSCDLEGSCCTDVQVELKNGEDQAVTNLLKDFNILSPAEFIIPWIMVFHRSRFDISTYNQTSLTSLLPPGTFPHSYLVHCNFRI